ncbi:MAG: hypothetical protein KDN18_00250 [Verrucomicrobiae bacterium]|nr:hypothetical protein [Verrucomicrobiae bacterium]
MGWAWCLSGSGIGRTADPLVPRAPALALFFAVWSIYLGDRLLDARRGDARRGDARDNIRRESDAGSVEPPALLPDRHAWARQHRGLLVSLLFVALAGGLATLPFLESEVIRSGVLTAFATATYFTVFRFLHHAPGFFSLPFKESAVAACFSAGATVAATSGHPFAIPPLLLVSHFLLVLGNCLLISRAEAAYDRIEDPAAFFAEPGKRHFLPPLVLSVSLVASLALLVPATSRTAATALVLCTSLTLILASRKALSAPTQPLADGIHLLTFLVAAIGNLAS